MHIQEYLQHLYDYNYWANQRYIKAAEGLTEEQLVHKQGHSWESVYRVLLHMMSSEWMWLERWNGKSPLTFLEPEDFPTLADIKNYWSGLEPRMRAFVRAQTEESLQKEISYTNTQAQTYRLPLWQMMAHLPNHNTHHRGELAAMFALLDAPHPEEEVIQYFLNASGQKKF